MHHEHWFLHLWSQFIALLMNPSWASAIVAAGSGIVAIGSALITLWYVILTRSLLMDSRKAAVGVRIVPDKISFNAVFFGSGQFLIERRQRYSDFL